jgi:hypothetical protein
MRRFISSLRSTIAEIKKQNWSRPGL